MGCRFALIFLLLPLGICAQQRAPFVGCRAEGQADPIDPPAGTGPIVKDSSLAYYKAAVGGGVLAPRGWHCLGIYGSGGAALLVAPQPFDSKAIFSSNRTAFTGPIIVLSGHGGDTAGRFAVADIIARVFPAYRQFTTDVYLDFSETKPKFGPSPDDKLTYKSDRIVEFRTPARAKGLGIQVWLREDEDPIDGVAMLEKNDETEDAVVLSVRLPANLRHLAPTIIHQVELDATKPPSH